MSEYLKNPDKKLLKIAQENTLYRFVHGELDGDDYYQPSLDTKSLKLHREHMRVFSVPVEDLQPSDIQTSFLHSNLLFAFDELATIVHYRKDLEKVAFFIYCNTDGLDIKYGCGKKRGYSEIEIKREYDRLKAGKSQPLVLQMTHFKSNPQLDEFKRKILNEPDLEQEPEPELETESVYETQKKNRFWSVVCTICVVAVTVFVIKNDQDPTWWPDLIEGLSRVTFW